jgi:hypothetical protein
LGRSRIRQESTGASKSAPQLPQNTAAGTVEWQAWHCRLVTSSSKEPT